MKKFFNFITALLLLSSLLQSASLKKMIGDVEDSSENSLQSMVGENTDIVGEAVSTASSSSSCSCSSSIMNAKIQMKKAIEDYVDDSNDAFDDLISQLQENYKELRNRTNNIENEDYFTDLKNKVSSIKNSKKMEKHKLLGYENMLFFSKNGIIEKEDRLKNIIQLIKSLESVENSIIVEKGE